MFSSIQRKSLRPLSFFSSSSDFGSDIVKAMERPSGDQLKLPTALFTSVRGSASPPFMFRRYRLFLLSLRVDVKAIQFPSGDHFGFVDDFSPYVSCTCCLVARLAIQICVTYSLLSAVI